MIKEHSEKLGSEEFKKIETTTSTISKFMTIGHNSSILLLALVEDILDLSKIESGTFRINISDFLLPDLFNEISDIFEHQ
jgi:signal transduction histidine kinase